MIPLLLIALSLWVVNLCLALSLPNERSAAALHLPQLQLHLQDLGRALRTLRAGGVQDSWQSLQEQGLSTCGRLAAW